MDSLDQIFQTYLAIMAVKSNGIREKPSRHIPILWERLDRSVIVDILAEDKVQETDYMIPK